MELTEWIAASRARFQVLVNEHLSGEQPSRFLHGFWTASYRVIDPALRPSLRDLVNLLSEVQGKESGWPPFWVPTRTEIAPYPFNNVVECWMSELTSGPDDSDFWRASPEGLFFLLRGYQDDGSDRAGEPGGVLDPLLPLWRAGECLLHAARMSPVLSDRDDASFEITLTWEGLQNRRLKEWGNRADWYGFPEPRCRQSSVEFTGVFRAETVRQHLGAEAKRATERLYEAFDFFELPGQVADLQMERLVDKTKRRYRL